MLKGSALTCGRCDKGQQGSYEREIDKWKYFLNVTVWMSVDP